MSVTLEEARQLKEKLELAISEQINTYVGATGLHITSLHLEEVAQHRIGQKATKIYRLVLEAHL